MLPRMWKVLSPLQTMHLSSVIIYRGIEIFQKSYRRGDEDFFVKIGEESIFGGPSKEMKDIHCFQGNGGYALFFFFNGVWIK